MLLINGREFKRKESEKNEADRYSTAHNGAVAGSSLVAGANPPTSVLFFSDQVKLSPL
jgi:hypothetical protein